MMFFLQDPSGTNFASLLDRTASNADEGGAIFAYATKSGIERFFRIPSIRDMLRRRRRFRLVVGTDAITNAEALLTVDAIQEEHPNLEAYAFLHDEGVTFHPKYCWFTHQQSLDLVVGSGNLTSRGLGGDPGPPQFVGNWEAFLVNRLEGDQQNRSYQSITEWLSNNLRDGRLLSLSNSRVRAKAVANSRVRLINPRGQRTASDLPATEQPIAEFIRQIAAVQRSPVMVRELPRNRSGQADVTQEGLGFFGFTGTPKRVLIQHVSSENQLSDPVERRIFVQSSRNYRIEISELAGLPDRRAPNDGREVLIAVKLDDNAFRYTIVTPDSAHYSALDQLLGEISPGRRRMRTRFTDTDELKSAWPAAPASLFPIAAITSEDAD